MGGGARCPSRGPEEAHAAGYCSRWRLPGSRRRISSQDSVLRRTTARNQRRNTLYTCDPRSLGGSDEMQWGVLHKPGWPKKIHGEIFGGKQILGKPDTLESPPVDTFCGITNKKGKNHSFTPTLQPPYVLKETANVHAHTPRSPWCLSAAGASTRRAAPGSATAGGGAGPAGAGCTRAAGRCPPAPEGRGEHGPWRGLQFIDPPA